MTGRQTTPRQEPLAPKVGFSELMTRMISANRAERAQRVKRHVERPAETEDESPTGEARKPADVSSVASSAPTDGALFATFLEAVPDAIVAVDAEGSIVLVNSQAETLFGYHRDELIGLPVELLVPSSVRDHSQQRIAYFRDPVSRPIGAGRELAGRRKDGSEFPAEISLASIDLDGQILVAAAVRDMSVRKRADAKFRSLLEAAPDAIVGVDP